MRRRGDAEENKMGQCGCGDMNVIKAYRIRDAVILVDEYHGCDDCDTPLGISLYIFTPEEAEKWLWEGQKIEPFNVDEKDKEGGNLNMNKNQKYEHIYLSPKECVELIRNCWEECFDSDPPDLEYEPHIYGVIGNKLYIMKIEDDYEIK
jgi:hypothetical protein